MGYERLIFYFGSPQKQVDMHSMSKNTLIVLKYAFIFYLICSTTPKRLIFPNTSFTWLWSAVIGII